MVGEGMHAWQVRHAYQGGVHGRGRCIEGGMHGREHVWWGGHAWQEKRQLQRAYWNAFLLLIHSAFSSPASSIRKSSFTLLIASHSRV